MRLICWARAVAVIAAVSLQALPASVPASAQESDHEAVPFQPLYLDLLFAKHRPDLLTDEGLIAIAEQHIVTEQYNWSVILGEIEKDQERRERGEDGLLSEENPVLAYHWSNMDQDRLAAIFSGIGADWSFVQNDSRYDPDFPQLIDAFIFDPVALEGREPNFAARDHLPVFRDHLLKTAHMVPNRLEIAVGLPAMGFDFERGELRFTTGGAERFLDGAHLLNKERVDLGDRFQYTTILPGRQASPVPFQNPGVSYGRTPSEPWRDLIDRLINRLSFDASLALDRELYLPGIAMSAAEAEAFMRAGGSRRGGLSLRIVVTIDSIHTLPPPPRSGTFHKALFHATLESVDIVSTEGAIVLRMPVERFRTREEFSRNQAERNAVFVPPVASSEGRPVPFTPEVQELLVAKFQPDTLNDAHVARAIATQWHLERAALRGEASVAGEMFVRRDRAEPEIVAIPEGEALTALVAPFRSWLSERAANLPDEIVVDIPLRRGLEEGYFPLGTGVMPPKLSGPSCSRQGRFLERNRGPQEAEAYAQACAFARAVEQWPMPFLTCGDSASLPNQRWHCGDGFSYLRAAQDAINASKTKASESPPIIANRLELDHIVRLSADDAAQTEGRRTAIRITAKVNDLRLETEHTTELARDADRLVDAHLTQNGLEGISVRPAAVASDPHWAIELTMLKAELIDTESQAVLAELERVAMPALPVELLPEPAAEAPGDAGPYGPEIFGLQLGMSFAEADEKIRAVMDVGEVLYASRLLVMDESDTYKSGRMYISKGRQQIITLYDEPPAAAEIVTGVALQILLPKSPGVEKQMLGPLIQKYGEPDAWTTSAYRPGNSPIWVDGGQGGGSSDNPFGSGQYACEPANYWNFNLDGIWRNGDGSEPAVLSERRFSRVPELKHEISDRPGSACGAALTATVDLDTFQASAALNVWLFDQFAYFKLFEQSRNSPADWAPKPVSGAQTASADSDPLADLLPRPQSETDNATGEAASGAGGDAFDILGLRLGMPFAEADAAIRAHMEVGRVLVRSREADALAKAGQITPFSSGRLYVSADETELIILYDEPPAAEGVVAAVVRQLRLPKGALAPEALYAQLRGKYGKEAAISTTMAPQPVLTWFNLPGGVPASFDTLNPYCHPVKLSTFALGHWRNEDGSDVYDATRFVTAPIPDIHVIAPITPELAGLCGSGLAAAIDPVFDPQWDTLNVWLYDIATYGDWFVKSQNMLSGGGGQAEGSEVKL